MHAIGGGVTLVEIQQNNDVTYRLYDYGRPRELHLDQGVSVSVAEPYAMPDRVIPLTAEEQLVASGAPFTLDIVQGAPRSRREIEGEMLWFIPLAGSGMIDGQAWHPGECWLITGGASVEIADSMSALLARPALAQCNADQQGDEAIPSVALKALAG